MVLPLAVCRVGSADRVPMRFAAPVTVRRDVGLENKQPVPQPNIFWFSNHNEPSKELSLGQSLGDEAALKRESPGKGWRSWQGGPAGERGEEEGEKRSRYEVNAAHAYT